MVGPRRKGTAGKVKLKRKPFEETERKNIYEFIRVQFVSHLPKKTPSLLHNTLRYLEYHIKQKEHARCFMAFLVLSVIKHTCLTSHVVGYTIYIYIYASLG